MSVTLESRPAPAFRPPAVVGAGLRVPLATGGEAEYANLDYAASAPCLAEVKAAVDDALTTYASVHRGAGYASRISTGRYEAARAALAGFVGARADDQVVFVRNTTDALNLLAHALPAGCTVVVFETEHHAALLPWEGTAAAVRRLPAPAGPGEAVRAARAALRTAAPGPRLLCVTGASNVTGELWPVAELAAAARAEGARTVLDAAQLAPHRPVDIQALGVDYVALSGHKLYAPFGAGVLAGRADWLRAAPPYLRGGGATRSVGARTEWHEGPERHEAGSPNVIGAHALAAACAALVRTGRERIAARERELLDRLRRGLAAVPGVTELSLWAPERDRVGIAAFSVDGLPADLLAAALSAEHGIGVRDGLFCAHPLTRRLLPPGAATAVRASIGLGTTAEHVDRLVAAVRTLAADGPAWTYAPDDSGRPAPVGR
ncbi:aminotransferase class V-fold PLP-dependent enzyme [Allonocardiopsis opalescens]|uniref:Selenocysteine lyase/cysteine desulfurase n=1 Tax=Allonocardiopsis opalescens TaxID=1144618 RepID=A0A2T0Q0Z4_9ACTN|nr:aminotransferase class V-fold PLP-dependent enzyme [Allonocardiopsis opalescens]PRX97385.1 selenocysteine lyase/cysteine desulfurase [Allonocardiopsis opalescens]